MPVTLTCDLPILQVWTDKRPMDAVRVKSMPRGLFMDAHERQAMTNHGQSLRELAQRGGLSAQECLLVLGCLPGRSQVIDLPHEEAHRLLYAIRVAFNRGGLVVRHGTEA